MSLHCLACGVDALSVVLELGAQPAANLLLENEADAFERVDLALMRCPYCGHLQQRSFFSPQRLFGHYLYRSATSQTLARFFDWLAQSLADFLPAGARVLELACNDGSFLDALQRHSLRARGIDPAENLVRLCLDRGLDVSCDFWPSPRESGRYEAVVALNVLAHTPEPLPFLHGLADVLSERGVALLQVSQADMVCNGEFDTLYHEHYSFFCLASMQALLARAGLRLLSAVKTTVHGGSLLVVCARADGLAADVPAFKGEFVDAASPLLLQPGADDMAEFVRKAQAAAQAALQAAQAARRAGRAVCLVGAAAKAVTFLQFSGLQVDAVFDEAELKWGRFIPGLQVPVRPLHEVAQIEGDALFVIGAWNFFDELKGKLAGLRPSATGDVVFRYFPYPLAQPLGGEGER